MRRDPNPSRRRPCFAKRRAFFLFDVLGALFLVGAIAAILTACLHRAARARDRLAAERAVARQLEKALVDLSLSKAIDPAITVTPLTTPHYVQVSADVAPGHPISLVGYVSPATTRPGGGQ